MEGALEFPFVNGERGQWLTSSGDEMAMAAAPADNFARSDWNEWMQWDPASSQTADLKPLDAQGPVCVPKPDQKPPLFDRRQSSHLNDPPSSLQSTDIPPSASHPAPMHSTAFVFGSDGEQPPTFGTLLRSPSTGEGHQHNGYYPPADWIPQHQPQPADSNMFSPQRFGLPTIPAAHRGPLSTPSLQHSPSSLNNGRTSSSSARSSPEPAFDNPKKRKSASEASDRTPDNKPDKQPPVKKTAHNMIEKRYRTNLNDKIAALRDSVPSLRVMSRPNGGNEEDDDPEDLEGLTPAHKLNKATVLSKATEYIRHLEKRNKQLQDEVATYKGRLESYEKMAISGPMSLHSHAGTPDGNRYHDDPFGPSSSMVPVTASGPPQGIIPVPESMASLHRGLPAQPHYAPQHGAYPPYTSGPARSGVPGPPLVNGRRSSALMGKLMVGSLAGLMILEGLAEREQSQEQTAGRGLFALPTDVFALLSPRVSVGGTAAHLPLAKLFLVFAAVFYIIAPLLDFGSKPKKKSIPAITLNPAPSLASPVEVRRKAWLTAIQTVWVPRHNFLLEVAALSLKTLKLSARKIVGWQGYALLTGITKDQEAARVKAWSIALDAQLTGGDAEISKSRLVLSLMASGTLPDTPARLMLKALHIRVLLWELANVKCGGWNLFDELSAKLARRYWNAARSEQKIAVNLASKPGIETEPLPDHLAALLELECDQVLIPNIVQRAYNLAWNKPVAEKEKFDKSMDGVVEDFAIASPLDALAAWWSSHTSRKALAGSLTPKDGTTGDRVRHDLEIAACTAPPTSQAQLRALVAKAVLLDEDRATHISTAFEALPLPLTSTLTGANDKHQAILLNLTGNATLSIDIQKAITFAKCLSLVESSSIEARRSAVYVINNITLPEATTSLLSFVAGYKILRHFIHNPTLEAETSHGLERLACSLRMWVGHEAARRSGLSNKIRSRLVSHCLDATKVLVGLAEREEIDDGYVSSSQKGD